jgi:hypothetical protein
VVEIVLGTCADGLDLLPSLCETGGTYISARYGAKDAILDLCVSGLGVVSR